MRKHISLDTSIWPYILCLIFLSIGGKILAQELAPKHQQAILQAMSEQETAWNAGEIDRFMEWYWRSDSLAFIGASGITYGWQQTKDNYHRRYPNRAAMGQLSFTILRLKKLGPKHAHLVGKWHLTREIGDIGGHFTLVWRRIGGQWLIVSDHTSSE